MTIADDIMRSISRSLNATATTMDLIDRLDNRKPGSVRSALSRLVKKGTLDRIERGVYRVKQLYRMLRHTKRIIETSSVSPLRDFDLDIETTSEGFVPTWKSLEEIEAVLNPKLIDETLAILNEEGVFLLEERVTFSIMGSEFLNQRAPRYDPKHEVEVVMVNNSGVRYVFRGSYNVRLKEYD